MNKFLVMVNAIALALIASADTLDDACKLIKEHESFESKVYVCPAGKKTIGYGFTDVKLIAKGRISRREADEILRSRVKSELNWVKSTFPKLDSKQQVAIASLAYNIGHDKLCWKTVNGKRVHTNAYTALKAGNWKRAAREISEFRCSNGGVLRGLVKRRSAECKLLLHT